MGLKVGRGNSFCRCRVIEAGACQLESARTTSSTSSKSSCPPNPSISPFPPFALSCPPNSAFSVGAAGGEPGQSWTATRRPHRGPRTGGDPRVRPPQRLTGLSRGPASLGFLPPLLFNNRQTRQEHLGRKSRQTQRQKRTSPHCKPRKRRDEGTIQDPDKCAIATGLHTPNDI